MIVLILGDVEVVMVGIYFVMVFISSLVSGRSMYYIFVLVVYFYFVYENDRLVYIDRYFVFQVIVFLDIIDILV